MRRVEEAASRHVEEEVAKPATRPVEEGRPTTWPVEDEGCTYFKQVRPVLQQKLRDHNVNEEIFLFLPCARKEAKCHLSIRHIVWSDPPLPHFMASIHLFEYCRDWYGC